ncbi:DNA-binding domain-containing protein [Paenibacillus tianmuensis]|uniref:DNA-binding domain-containing protein n=1 Tax=Paenibacillus tianmuensis TaxID=624147 RepID=UPI00115FFBA4|nr:DNA-binding domain-containing protein [Paenibacillus tianmuensis]
MNESDFLRLCEQHQLSGQTIAEIRKIRSSPPARRVESSRGNLSGFYSSKKMGVTIQYESHTLELPCIYLLEHDPKVYEYYDQPPSFPIRYVVDGKRRGHLYTSDYFIISEDFIGWRECKTEAKLEKLSSDHPERYCLIDQGIWDMPPVREYARQLGLSFQVWTNKEIDWIFQSNLEFLEDYYAEEQIEIDADVLQQMKVTIKNKQGITLKELYEQIGRYSDIIYKSIVLEEIYIDLYQERITDWEYVKVFTDQVIASAYSIISRCSLTERSISPAMVNLKGGSKIQWDGRALTIINHGETKTTLADDQGEPMLLSNTILFELINKGEIRNLVAVKTVEDELRSDIFLSAGPADLEEATRRCNIVFPIITGEKKASDFDIPGRTLRDWIAKYKRSEEVYGNGFLGLLPNRKNQGNRTSRLNDETKKMMEIYIDDYESSTNKVMKTVWRALRDKCKEKGIYCPPYQTFTEHVNARPKYEQTRKREGYKAANKYKPFHYFLEMQNPRHGERPFQIGHIDHTELDLELRCSKTGKELGKTWVTFLIDAFTRRILAFYLTYDAPSIRSCMMVIRECVKRHGKLPKTLVVDGGKEFSSVYFEALLAIHGLNKKVRKGQPRAGSVIERLFGVTNKMFIHNLLGNTQVMKNARQVTPDVNPKKKSAWTLPELSRMMALWAYDVYDTREHISLGESPRDAYLNGIAKSGNRDFTIIAYNEEFKLLTLPSTPHQTLKVYVGRGVKFNYMYYNAPALKQPGVENTTVPVRYDPYNIGIVYAYVKNKWVLLRSEHYLTFINRTEKELQIITEELKKRTQNTVKNGDSITASKIASFMTSAEGKQIALMQHLRDLETKQALLVLDGDEEQEKLVGDEHESVEEEKGKNELQELAHGQSIIDHVDKVTNLNKGKVSETKKNGRDESPHQVFEELIF